MGERTSGRNISGLYQPFAAALNKTCNASNHTGPVVLNTANDIAFGRVYIWVTSSLFGVILLTSLVGNSLVTFTIFRRKNMRTPCNFFIMNIALADIGVGAIAAPLRILEMFLSWPFGDFICHFLWPIQDVFVCVSVMTHTTIALERYRAIRMPLKPKITLGKTKIAIVVIWLGCYCASGIPQSFLLGVIDNLGWKHCYIQWPSSQFRLCYIFYLVISFILIPLVAQTWCYVRIAHVLNHERNFGNSTRIVSRNGSDELKAQRRRKKRMVRMLITSLIFFQVCYIPRGILMLMIEFQPLEVTLSQTFAYVDLVSLVLYYCKHIANPVILFVMSGEFQKAFIASLKCAPAEPRDALLSQQHVTNQGSPQNATCAV